MLGAANATGAITAGAAFHAFPQATSALNMVKLAAILFLCGIFTFVIAYIFWFVTTVEMDHSLHNPDEAVGPEQIFWVRDKTVKEYRESGKKKFIGAAISGLVSFIFFIGGSQPDRSLFFGPRLSTSVYLDRGQAAIDRCGTHVILRGDLRNRQFASVHKRAYRTPLAIIELARSATLAASGAR